MHVTTKNYLYSIELPFGTLIAEKKSPGKCFSNGVLLFDTESQVRKYFCLLLLLMRWIHLIHNYRYIFNFCGKISRVYQIRFSYISKHRTVYYSSCKKDSSSTIHCFFFQQQRINMILL